MRGLYQQSVSAAPLTVARHDEDGSGRGGAAAGEQQQRHEGRMEVIELADGHRVVLPRGLSAAEEEQLRQKQQKPTVHIEKVVNAWGSAAGAGSDFFDCYRRTRNVELRRVEKMEEEFRKKVETEEFQLQRHRRIEEAAQKNAAARERRRRRKMKRQEQQQSRLNVKKSDPAAAAATGDDSNAVAVDNNYSRTTSSSRNNNSNNIGADASASLSAEAHTKNTGITHVEDRTALSCPTGEIKRVTHSSKKEQWNADRGSGDEGEEEEDGGEDGASVCSEEESEGTKCGAQEENNAAQSPGQKKRRRMGDTTEKKHSPAPTQIHQCKLKSENEEKDRQLGSAGSTEVTERVNTEEEEEEGEARIPVMKAGMITVRDDDW